MIDLINYTTYLTSGDVQALITLGSGKESPPLDTSSSGFICVTTFHGLTLLGTATQVTFPCSPAGETVGNAKAHVPPVSLGAIGRP